MTVHEIIATGRRRLAGVGLAPDEAALDARLLAQHLLGWSAADLLASGLDAASTELITRYDQLVTRRAAREPLAYITGTKEFWGLPMTVSPAVLIPRPETELLVETALERLADPELTVADVCTGSGCVAIALATAHPRLRIVATDISEQALAIATANVRRHDVGDRVRLMRTDILSGVVERFGMIVANPPYIPTGDRPQLQPEVRDYEPALALFGGDRGLDVIRTLAEHATVRLRPGGWLIFECGAGQAKEIRELIARVPPLVIVEHKKDLQGIPRVVVCRLDTPLARH